MKDAALHRKHHTTVGNDRKRPCKVFFFLAPGCTFPRAGVAPQCAASYSRLWGFREDFADILSRLRKKILTCRDQAITLPFKLDGKS